ncbi:MAG: hypothetical protein H7Y17_06925, partial [Chlorobia bacterium]|nr:hypothetical protein [Fimbriimonadaceae bacterium]
LDRALTQVEVGEWLMLDDQSHSDEVVPLPTRELWFARLEPDLQELLTLNFLKNNEIARNTLALQAERASLSSERDRLLAARDSLTSDFDRLVAERNDLVSERGELVSGRETLVSEQDRLVKERDSLIAEHAMLHRKLHQWLVYVTILSIVAGILIFGVMFTLTGQMQTAKDETETAKAETAKAMAEATRLQGVEKEIQTTIRLSQEEQKTVQSELERLKSVAAERDKEYRNQIIGIAQAPLLTSYKAYPTQVDVAAMQLLKPLKGELFDAGTSGVMQLAWAGYRRAEEELDSINSAFDLLMSVKDVVGEPMTKLTFHSFSALIYPQRESMNSFVRELQTADSRTLTSTQLCEVIAPWLERSLRPWKEDNSLQAPSSFDLQIVYALLKRQRQPDAVVAEHESQASLKWALDLLELMTETIQQSDAEKVDYDPVAQGERFRAWRNLCWAWLALGDYLTARGLIEEWPNIEAPDQAINRLAAFTNTSPLWEWAMGFATRPNDPPLDALGVTILRERLRLQQKQFAIRTWANGWRNGQSNSVKPFSDGITLDSKILPPPYRLRAELLKHFVLYFNEDDAKRLAIGPGIAGYVFRLWKGRPRAGVEEYWPEEAAQILGDFTTLQFTEYCRYGDWPAAKALLRRADVILAQLLSEWKDTRPNFTHRIGKTGKTKTRDSDEVIIPTQVHGGDAGVLNLEVVVRLKESRVYIRSR